MEVFVRTKCGTSNSYRVYPNNDNMLHQFREMLNHSGELNANYTRNENCGGSALCVEGVGKIWMVVNSRILNLVDYVYCRSRSKVTMGSEHSVYSSRGYIVHDNSRCTCVSPSTGCSYSVASVSSTLSITPSTTSVQPTVNPSIRSSSTSSQSTASNTFSSTPSTTCSGTSATFSFNKLQSLLLAILILLFLSI